MKTAPDKGIVYILSNKAFPDKDGKKILKIGRTTDLLHRLRVLNIGVPDDYQVEYALQLDADQYVLAETFLHQLFHDKNEKREFYRIDLKTAINKMEQVRIMTKGEDVTQLYQNSYTSASSKTKSGKAEIILLCKGKGANAKGIYDVKTKQFVLLKGSVIEPDTVNSFHNPARRGEWIKLHVSTKKGLLTLKEDCPFNSPSQASEYVLGRPSNGWTEWKTEDGMALADIYNH